MPLQTNDFIIRGFVAQPDGLTPVAGDIEIVFTNNGLNSNAGTPFTFCTTVINGEFAVDVTGLVPPPLWAAADGDTLTIEIRSLTTTQIITINDSGDEVDSIDRVITLQDIIARNGDVNDPEGLLELYIVLAQTANLHSNSMLFRGDVFQSDATTPVPLGAEVLIENLTKNTSYRLPVTGNGDYSQVVSTSPGFDTGDELRFSAINGLTGDVLQLNIAGTVQNFITRDLEEDDLIARGRDPNQGEVVQSFVLNENFAGLLLPPSSVTTEAGDSRVAIRWNNVFNPTLAGFRVERSLTPTGPFFSITGEDPVDRREFDDTGVINGVSYYYRVITILDDDSESAPSGPIQGTPVAFDLNFSIRQRLENQFVAGRNLQVSFSALRRSGLANGLTAVLKYVTQSGVQAELIVLNPTIPVFNTYQSFSETVTIPNDALRLVDFRFRQTTGSEFVVDDITLNISGATTDPAARAVVAPSYNKDASKIIVKNLLPGEMFLIDVETGDTTRLLETGNGSVEGTNATTDPVEWVDNKTIAFSYFTGIDENENPTSEIRRMDFLPSSFFPTAPAIIPDTVNGFFPRYNEGTQSIVFLLKQGNTRAIKSIGLRDDSAADFINIDATGANSFDLDADGFVVLSTNEEVLFNDLAGGQSRRLLNEGSSWVQWGNKRFIPGKVIAYQKSGIEGVNKEVYRLTLLTDLSNQFTNHGEFTIDTRNFPDGPVNIRVRAIDDSVSRNETIIEINNLVINSQNLRPMTARAISDPGRAPNATNATAPNAITGPGIANGCINMSSGVSSANRGRIEFMTRDTDQILTTLQDTFTDRPSPTISNPGLPDPVPIKLRITWLTDLVQSEPGGQLNGCILTVDTGGVVRNIFLPEMSVSATNPLILYVAEDGSTFFDPSLRFIARKASGAPLVSRPPALDPLTKYTNTASVNLKWCNNPGDPIDQVRKYIIFRSTDPNTGFTPLFETLDNDSREFRDTDVVNGVAYFYRIAAVDILGNVIMGRTKVFTIVDQTGQIERLGFIEVDLNIDDIIINEGELLEPGTGKVFSSRTTFNLNPDRNRKSPTITSSTEIFTDYTFQKPKDVLLVLQPVLTVNSVVGEVSGAFTKDVDWVEIEDNGVMSGSVQGRDKVRFIRQTKTIVEEELERGPGLGTSDALGNLFATKISSISMPITVRGEPVSPVSGFLARLTNTEPGRFVDGKQQVILEIENITNTTKGFVYEVDNIVPLYTQNPALLQLDIFLNMSRFPFPDATDELEITYTYLQIFPADAYFLDRSQNSVNWNGTDPRQPREGQRYLVTYDHLAPIPGERLTIGYNTNKLVRTLQAGDINTGVQGVNEKRHITADVLARETNPVDVDVVLDVRLFDTADEGFVTNQIAQTVSDLFNGKKLGDGIRISDIACAVTTLPEVESVKLDPVQKIGRTDMPHFLKIDVTDRAVFSIPPGRVQGVITFFTNQRPMQDVIIPQGTIVSNEFNVEDTEVLLFETTNTFTAPFAVIDTFYNQEKDRFEFRVPIRALFEGSATVGRGKLTQIGGVLRNSLAAENETIVEGAFEQLRAARGNGTLTIRPIHNQLLEIVNVYNYSARNEEAIPTNVNFIKLQKRFISNLAGNDAGNIADSSVIFDDGIVFNREVTSDPPANPGEYFINYTEGFIKSYTKTSSRDIGGKIRYRYREKYNLDFVTIAENKETFTLHGPSNAGKPVPQLGDLLVMDYRWTGDGIPLKYRIETFSTPNGVLDLSFITSDDFTGSIYINNRSEVIESVATHPQPPFYAYDRVTRQLAVVGRTIDPGEEIIFRYETPFGQIDLVMMTFNLQTRTDTSILTFNVDYRNFQIDEIKFLEMGGTSVQESPGMMINGGLEKTSSRDVVVQLAAVNATEMLLSTDPLFRDKGEIDFEPFSTTKLFLLDDTEGLQTVFVKLRFANTGIKDYDLQQSIELDFDAIEGRYIPVESLDFQYSPGRGILSIPTSFGQSDIIINAMESIRLHDIVLEYDPTRIKRTF